jgi:AraC family transcriptional regulator
MVEMYFKAPVHMLLAYEEGLRQQGETRVRDTPTSTVKNLRRKLTFVPAGHEFHEWHVPVTAPQFICFYIEPSEQFCPPSTSNSSAALAPKILFEDRVLWETVSKLKVLIEGGATNTRYLEAIGTVLSYELSQIVFGQTSPERPARGGLAAWQLRVVTEYIEEHLSEEVSLITLAKLVRRSPHHFCRAFKESSGVSPCRYHGLRRLELAKLLLANSDEGIANVALQLGFSDTSAFTTAFRRGAGITPTAFRRSFG